MTLFTDTHIVGFMAIATKLCDTKIFLTQHLMGISLSTQNCSSICLFTESTTYSQRCFKHSLSCKNIQNL